MTVGDSESEISFGIFCGCFYVAGEQKRTDWFVRHVYERTGFFTPPYETAFSLKKRLEKLYATVTLGTVFFAVGFSVMMVLDVALG